MRVHFRAYGSVQGVGYRWFVKDAADRAGLTGLVRNLSDGSVEGEVQGGEQDVDSFLLRLRKGHPYAEVSRVTADGMPERVNEAGFVIDRSRQG